MGRLRSQLCAGLLRLLLPVDPTRAASCLDVWAAALHRLCINPKESEDVGLAEEVLAIIPEFMKSPNVLGIGEIGLNKNSRNEVAVLEKHIDLAASNDQLILVHTPHLEDKRKGTRLILDILS